MKLSARIRNNSSAKMTVEGIYIDRTLLDDAALSSAYLVIPQGDSAQVHRFECDLDRLDPVMQKFELVDYRHVCIGGENFFSEGSIEIDGGSISNLYIVLIARMNSYRVNSITVVYRIGKGKLENLPIDIDYRYIYCPGSVPDDGWYIRSTASYRGTEGASLARDADRLHERILEWSGLMPPKRNDGA